MSMKIINSDQPMQVENIIVTIYGAPDAGKTTLAQTAENPFIEDYDEGLQRSAKRQGSAGLIKDWSEAVEFHQSGQLKEMGIKTLIVDTAGTMLDNFIASYIMKNNPKMKQSDGTMSLKGYGAMKSIFNQFRIDVKLMGVDVVFIAHDTDKEEGGENRKVPKVTGGSYDILKAASDLMGYMHFKNGKRFIGFSTTDYYYGKNCAELPVIEIPHYEDPEYDGFLGRLIQQTKDKMNRMSEEMTQAQAKVNEFKQFINDCKDLEELESLKDNIDTGLSKTYVVQIQKIYDEKFIELFYEWINNIVKPEELNNIIVFASKQDKKYNNQMKSAINKKLTENNWTYNKTKQLVEIVSSETDPKKDSKKDKETKSNTINFENKENA